LYDKNLKKKIRFLKAHTKIRKMQELKFQLCKSIK